MDFSSKTVLITGSTRNTGLGIAKRFARLGATVVVNGTTTEAVTEAADQVRQVATCPVIEAAGRIDVPDDVESIFRTVEQASPRLDVLISNAVVQGVGYEFQETPEDLFDQVMSVNVKGLFMVAQRAARMMIARGGGAIVNIGSNVAGRAIRQRTAYVASKAAVEGLTRAMAIDLAPYQIRVNCVAAGYIHTERWDTLDPAHAERRRKNVPLGQEAQADDIAQAAAFLASDAARNITGTRIDVDGGCTAQHMPIDADL